MASISPTAIYFFFTFIYTSGEFLASATRNNTQQGFSVNIYQRDSPGSPFYDPTLSQTDRLLRAVARSVARANSSALITPHSPMTHVWPYGAEYLMKLFVGTPTVQIHAVVDTGSDMIWTQCRGCEPNCFPQTREKFDPRRSSTYHQIPCSRSAPCPLGPHENLMCVPADSLCHHSVRYLDNSYSQGFLSRDTITMASSGGGLVQLANLVFGCGTNNGGKFGGGASGVIGLGAGAPSLISQLGQLANGRFSYCLIPFYLQERVTRPSVLHFGANAVVEGPGVVRTPLVPIDTTHYHVTLEAFTVGRKRVALTNNRGRVEQGNIILDSGTNLVALPRRVYQELRLAVTTQVQGTPVPDPQNLLDLCYRNSRSLTLPPITAHFRGGDLVMNRYNAFVDQAQGITCLAFTVSMDHRNFFGNFAQQTVVVGYDKISGVVSFRSVDCQNY